MQLGKDADSGAQKLRIDRNGDVIDRAALVPRQFIHVGYIHCRNEGNRYWGVAWVLPDNFGQPESVYLWHDHVEQHHTNVVFQEKHILGIELGATENAAAVKRLLTGLRDHGLPTDRKYLFVTDGAKALRAAIEELFGAEQAVQRCRNHKIRNVLNELPKEQHAQTRNLMRTVL
jgi:Transposase, Mutator family